MFKIKFEFKLKLVSSKFYLLKDSLKWDKG